MLTCKEISKLVSDGIDRQLPFGNRLLIRFHLLYCVACRRFRRQIEFLRSAGRRYSHDLEGEAPEHLPGLSEDARRRISDTLARD